jgi:hypothetical protein
MNVIYSTDQRGCHLTFGFRTLMSIRRSPAFLSNDESLILTGTAYHITNSVPTPRTE